MSEPTSSTTTALEAGFIIALVAVLIGFAWSAF